MAAPRPNARLKVAQHESETVAQLAAALSQGIKDSIAVGETPDRDAVFFLLESIQSSLSRSRWLVSFYFDLLEIEEEERAKP